MPPKGHSRYGSVYATRLDPRIEAVPESGCWVWMSGCDKDGYGRTWRDGKSRKAHREFWQSTNGPIPEGLVIDHICRVRSCVNPDHMRVVDAVTNVMTNSGGIGAVNAKKSCCSRCGGPYERVKWTSSGRACVPCKRADFRRNYAKRRIAQGKPYLPVTEWRTSDLGTVPLNPLRLTHGG